MRECSSCELEYKQVWVWVLLSYIVVLWRTRSTLSPDYWLTCVLLRYYSGNSLLYISCEAISTTLSTEAASGAWSTYCKVVAENIRGNWGKENALMRQRTGTFESLLWRHQLWHDLHRLLTMPWVKRKLARACWTDGMRSLELWVRSIGLIRIRKTHPSTSLIRWDELRCATVRLRSEWGSRKNLSRAWACVKLIQPHP